MAHFDYILAGGGAAGLGLAYQMVCSGLRDQKILMIDRAAKNQNDRTWCFWTDRPFLFDPIVYRSWERIRFQSDGFERVLPAAPFHYNLIRGIDFYQYSLAELERHPNVTFLESPVDQIIDGQHAATVIAGGEAHTAGWVFDSIIRPGSIQPDPQRFHFLKQHFKGWELETSADAFDPSTPTMFDFRTPQNGSMRFVYVLPFSPRRALVEYTLFSADLLPEHEYDAALSAYVTNQLGLRDYQVTTTETGIIPMTDLPFPRRLGRRVMAIGTRGGRVKPSSGYAFLRMQQDAARIVAALQTAGDPFRIPADPLRYHFYDVIMLQLMYRQGGRMKDIFTQMFARNPLPRIFHFLNEDQSFSEDLRLMASLPVGTFLAAMLKVYLLRKI